MGALDPGEDKHRMRDRQRKIENEVSLVPNIQLLALAKQAYCTWDQDYYGDMSNMIVQPYETIGFTLLN